MSLCHFRYKVLDHYIIVNKEKRVCYIYKSFHYVMLCITRNVHLYIFFIKSFPRNPKLTSLFFFIVRRGPNIILVESEK